MKIKIIMIGKSFPEYTDKGISYYLNKLKHIANIEWVELVSKLKSNDIAAVKKHEAELIMKHIDTSDYIILLDDKGTTYSSEGFGKFIEQIQMNSTKQLVFIIGGAFGFDNSLYIASKGKLSMSTMTFSHQIIRIIFLEQLYRAFTIIKGIPYHNA